MILVDTSVWVQFLRGHADAMPLGELLSRGEVCCHPWVIGELALGNLGRKRDQILTDLGRLEALPTVSDSEVLFMVDDRKLMDSGIGWVDAQLLASSLVGHCELWTLDKTLDRAAQLVGL